MELEDFEDFEAPDESQLNELSELAQEVIGLRDKMADLSAALKELSSRERELSQQILPEKMRAIGMMMFKTESGHTVKIEHKVKASLSAARREAGFAWLREQGYGSLIKERTVEETVHPQTLSAFVREQLQQGAPIPTTLFGVFEYDETVIK